jgi:hypothetical protein
MRYLIGDRVLAVTTIQEGPCEDSPGQVFCSIGDILVVRSKCTTVPSFDYYVSHPEVLDSSFAVTSAEIEPAQEKGPQ